MQVCTSLQTGIHANTPPLSFLQAGCSSCRQTTASILLESSTNQLHNLLTEPRLLLDGKKGPDKKLSTNQRTRDTTLFVVMPPNRCLTSRFWKQHHQTMHSLTLSGLEDYFCDTNPPKWPMGKVRICTTTKLPTDITPATQALWLAR